MVTPWGNNGVSCLEKEIMQGTMPGARRRGRPRTAWMDNIIRGQDYPWKSQSEWQRTEINGESTSMVWPIIGSRTAKEQNRSVDEFDANQINNSTFLETLPIVAKASLVAERGYGVIVNRPYSWANHWSESRHNVVGINQFAHMRDVFNNSSA